MRHVRATSIAIATAWILAASAVAKEGSADAVRAGAFGWLDPPELQFSCAIPRDETEATLAKTLSDGKAEPAARIAAARALWRGRSRRYAADVIAFVSGRPPGGSAFRRLQRSVLAALEPDAILHLLTKEPERRVEGHRGGSWPPRLEGGDYVWGAWLSFLRPDPKLVPALLDALEAKPKLLPETMLALGNSGDRRALDPLLRLLESDDYRIAGDAAGALGYFGAPEVEPELIAALAADNGVWRQAQACAALAKMGTRAALPALKRVAATRRYTGVLNVVGTARRAIKRIEAREPR